MCLLAKIDRKDESLRISLFDAWHFLALSWDYVASDTIADCFSKCRFGTGPDAALTGDDQELDEDLVIEGWKSLETQASAQDFVTADDNVAVCGSIEDLLDEVNEIKTDTDGEDADVCDQPPSASETLYALDVLHRTVSAGSMSYETAA